MSTARFCRREQVNSLARLGWAACAALVLLTPPLTVQAQTNGAGAAADGATPGADAAAAGSSLAANTSASAPSDSAAPDAGVPIVLPWEYSPYRIHVWVAAADSPALPQPVLERIRHQIIVLSDSLVGAPWSLHVEPPPEELWATLAYAPEMLTVAEIGRVAPEVLKDDKIVWISLEETPRDIRVLARELDCATRSWSHTEERRIRQPAQAGRTAFDALLAVFTPLARIEEGQGKSCICRARAGGLILSSNSPAFIGRGDVLQPIFRQNDRFGDPVRDGIQPLPFTFLQVASQDEQSSSLLNCNVQSGLRSPIRGRSSARRQRWAIKVRPILDQTQLIVATRPPARDKLGVPLAGMEVYAKTPPLDLPKPDEEPKPAPAASSDTSVFLGVTDWRGSLDIPKSESLLQLIYVKSGGLLLARLPMVVGLHERLTAEVPDDNPRLQAEGFVKGMSGEIMDLVVQRQLLRIRFRKQLEAGQLDKAEQLLDEFRGLRSMTDLLNMLDQQMSRQKPTNNPSVKQRIDKLYADERTMIARYVDVEMLNELQRELATARANPVVPSKPAETSSSDSESSEKKKELPPALKSASTGK